MILDTGWDLLMLSRHELWQNGKRTNKLILIGADHELRLNNLECVTVDFTGSLSEHIDAVLAATEEDFLRYAAIAHEAGDFDDPMTDYPATKELEARAAQRGVHLLSRLFITPSTWCSTGPMRTFSTYPMHRDNLPTVTVSLPERYPEPRRVRPPDRARADRSR